MIKSIKFQIIYIILVILSGCSSKGIIIDNSLPKAKIVIQKKPEQDKFYNATYESVSQEIYDKNFRIIPLNENENKIPLDDKVQEYAIYFILPTKKNNSNQWKYIINSDSTNDFSVSNVGIIKKI